MPAGAHAHEDQDRWYGGGELGLVTSHNARPAIARPVRGFVGGSAEYPRAYRDLLDCVRRGEVRLRTKAQAFSGG